MEECGENTIFEFAFKSRSIQSNYFKTYRKNVLDQVLSSKGEKSLSNNM